MKQHITTDQLNELSDKAKEALREWWVKTAGLTYGEYFIDEKGYEDHIGNQLQMEKISHEGLKVYPLVSVMQMIEFLFEANIAFDLGTSLPTQTLNHKIFFSCKYSEKEMIEVSKHSELCDSLWEAMKEVLERGDK